MQQRAKCQKSCSPLPTCMNDYAYAEGLLAASKVQAVADEGCILSSLPTEVLENVLRFCDAETLAAVSQTCSLFRAFDAGSGLRLVEKAAKSEVQNMAGQQSDRWRLVLLV